MSTYRILVIDDDELMREFVEEALLRAGYRVDTASGGGTGLEIFDEHGHDLVITDLKMTPVDGLTVLKDIMAKAPGTHVVVMTAYGTIETAVDALKSGASDYILKPFTPDTLLLTIKRAVANKRLREENQYLRNEVNGRFDFETMIGNSKAMQGVYNEIQKVADTRATVLIRGESGTGKELVARAIHYGGGRREEPFIRVNCAALSAGILESELFGHERGAFTNAHERKVGRFELADKGTLLLDEVSEIGVELQPKLLRVLQEREFERVGGTDTIGVDTHVLATSNRALEKAVQEGAFRQDLFYRLNVISLVIPPLRERKEDLPPLMSHFIQTYSQEYGRNIEGYTDGVLKQFQAYTWPGNVRELENVIQRAVILAEERKLGTKHFQLGGPGSPDQQSGGVNAGVTVAAIEKELIMATLEHCDQNRTKAAELLGISVRTLRNKLKEYSEA